MFEIYKYALENPKSSISEAVFRMRRICNRADAIMINVSGGKDSSLDFDLLMNEIIFRRTTPPGNFDVTDHEQFCGYFELEETNRNIPFVVVNFQDAEIIYTYTREHIIYDKIIPYCYGLFIYKGKIVCGYDPIKIDGYYDNLFAWWQSVKAKSSTVSLDDIEIEIDDGIKTRISNGVYGKPRRYGNVVCIVEGKGIVHPFYKCLPISYQNISSFSNEECFVAWNKEKKDMWVTEIPDRTLLSCNPITEDNWDKCNLTPKSLLPSWVNTNVVKVDGIECYVNWGFGSDYLNSRIIKENKATCGWSYFGQSDEESRLAETNTFSRWLCQQTPDEVDTVYVNEARRHDFDFYSIVSLRSEESMDRNMILKQSNYFNSQYGYIDRRTKR